MKKESTFKIGWASRVLSKDEPASLPGQFYVRISEGILDPITTTALVMEDKGELAVLISLDAVSARGGLLDIVREKVAKRIPSFPVMKITISVTHTHTGPGFFPDSPKLQKLAPGEKPDNKDPYAIPTSLDITPGKVIQERISDEMADMIQEAYENRAPGGIAYGYGYATVGHSRRVLYFDDVSKRPGAVNNSTHAVNGHAVMYGKTNDPKFSGYEAGADPIVNFLYTFDTKGKLTGAIINAPCPSQNSEGMWQQSASFWHEARTMIRKKHGDIFILPQCGAAGDLSPRILHYQKAQERRFLLKYGRTRAFSEEFERLDIAERIYNAFNEVYSWAKKDIHTAPKFLHDVRTVKLTKRPVLEFEYEEAVRELAKLEKEQFEAEGSDPRQALQNNSRLVAGRNRWKAIITKYEAQKTEKKLPMEMHVIALDEVAFATNRFELYMDFQHRIQARSPFLQSFIIQLSAVTGNDGGSYLPTERAFKNKGYGASRFCNRVAAKGGQDLVEATLKVMNELAGKMEKM